MTWDTKYWGIESSSPLTKKHLLGAGWCRERSAINYHPAEPMRALLFRTRKAAREWAADERARFAGHPGCCADWRFRVVRVLERVAVI